jgi:XTP/dITP diphosphohydrolase
MEVRFVSGNPQKFQEAQEILGRVGITVVPSTLKIEELQTTNIEALIHDKLLKAFNKIGRPLFVEHTGLYLDHLNGLPGGLTQIFWDTLEADRFSELFGKLAPITKATARTTISYCDGLSIRDFTGEIAGVITPEPRGSRTFQWDCVFQPKGEKETFAEMGERKNTISMRRIALDQLASHLEEIAK